MPGLQPLSVGAKEAAAALGIGYHRFLDLIREGVIATVPHASSASRIVVAVTELERFAAQGVTITARSLRSAS